MRVSGEHYRTIWSESGDGPVVIIDQTELPHSFVLRRLTSTQDVVEAIRSMRVRGAPLIGVTAAFGVALAARRDPSDAGLADACAALLATRPTAVNLRWALSDLSKLLERTPKSDRAEGALRRAQELCDADAECCRAIGEHGFGVIRDLLARTRKASLNILTHCNAGWLATVDWGTALAPVYVAHEHGVRVHVWVDETRPRNQGASLTAWELAQHGIEHTVVVDNAGGHLMQSGLVDLCIVGTDRTTSAGDVCNKIGTYLKALAAHDNQVPFYVAAPSPSIDWSLTHGVGAIPIEERDASEVHEVWGLTPEGRRERVRVTPKESPAKNYGFDVTPARLVTGLITERGVCAASRDGLRSLFPESCA